MKTIQMGGSRNTWSVLLLMGVLGALYYYQRQGGRVSQLLSRGWDGFRSARDSIGRIAPSPVDRDVNTAAPAGV